MAGTPVTETREFARELKFLLPQANAANVRAWARRELGPDPHGTGAEHDQYETTTLYFDTADFDVFNRRGSFGRSKLRVRRYGDAPDIFLERKLRTDGLLAKRRTLIPALDLAKLSAPVDREWSGHWFHKRLTRRGLSPVCQLSYSRTARMGDADGSPVRLTIDTNLRVHSTRALHLGAPIGASVLSGHSILELKFRGEMPQLFRNLLQSFALESQSVSKYRLGAAALNPALASSLTTHAPLLVPSGEAL